MKQLLFMIAMEIIAIGGTIFRGPFVAVAVYYLFAVLRPQYLWNWSLPRGIGWSDYPAWAAIVGLVGFGFGILPFGERRKDEEKALGLSGTHWCFLVFGCWIILTYFTALSQATAWKWLQEYLTIFVMFAVATMVLRTAEQTWIMYLVTTAPLMYLAYHINSLYIFDQRLDIYHVGLGGLDNNGAGLEIAMSVPLAIGAWEAVRKWWRWIFMASIPLALHAVLMSYSRGAMVSLLAVLPVLILRSRRRWQFLLVACLLAATVPYLAGEEIRARFFTISDYQDDRAANQRFGSWKAAIAIANDHPIFGVGIRNANLISFQYGADMEGRTIHSQFLQILADEGYVGLSLYVLTLLSFFLGCLKKRRQLRGRTDLEANRVMAMLNGLEASLLIFCVGGVFLSLEVFELPYLIILLGAQIAVLPVPEPVAAQEPSSIYSVPGFPHGTPAPSYLAASR